MDQKMSIVLMGWSLSMWATLAGGESATTFKHYVAEKKPRFAIRFSRRNLRQDGGFVNIPLYLSERYRACLSSLPPTTP